MIQCGNLPAGSGGATEGGGAAAGANLTSRWSGSSVEDTLEEVGFKTGRVENLVTLRCNNRSMNQKSSRRRERNSIQHWMDPVLQELEMPPPWGAAATKMAIDAAANRVSLDNIVKMSSAFV